MDGMTPAPSAAHPHEVHHHYESMDYVPYVYARRGGRRRARTSLDIDDDMYDHGDVHVHNVHEHEGAEKMIGLEGMLLGMCQKQGIDPAIVAMMKDKEHDGMFGGGSGMLVLLFLIILLGGGRGFGHDGFGFGGAGGGYGGAGIVNQIDFKTLLDAINNNSVKAEIAQKELATNLHIDFDDVKKACAVIDHDLLLQTSKIENMDQAIKCAIKECCCTTALNIERSTNELSRQIAKCCCDTDRQFAALERRMDEQFCKTDALIVKVDTDNRIRELEERNRRLENENRRSFERRQTDVILDALQKIAPAGTVIEDVDTP